MGTKAGAPEHPGWQDTVPQLTEPQAAPQSSATPAGQGGTFTRTQRSLWEPMQPSAQSLGSSMPPSAEQLVTFRGPRSPQMVNGPQDEPQGFLLITRDAHHLHGSLELVELLSRLLLLLWLQRATGSLGVGAWLCLPQHPNGPGTPIPPSSPPPSPAAATLDSGVMPKTLFSARWLK